MKLTYLRGVVVFGLILGLNYGMNKVLEPKIEHSRYHYTLSATQLDLKKGAIYTLSATGDDAKKINWISSDENVASISSNGQIVAKADGQTIVSAKVHHESKDIIVNVSDNPGQDVLIYNDAQTIAAASEVPSKTSIASFKMTLSKNKYTYDGKAKKPKVTIFNSDGSKLTKNTDYTISYKNNKKAGTAKVIATGAGNYTGTLVGTFKIEKAEDDDHTTTDTTVEQTAENASTSTVSSTVNTETVTPVLTPTTSSEEKKSTTTKKSSTSTKKKSTANNSNSSSSSKNTSNSTGKTSHHAANSSNTSGSGSNGSSAESNTSSNTSNSSSNGENNSSTNTNNSSENSNTSTDNGTTSSSSGENNSSSSSSSSSASTDNENTVETEVTE